MTSVSLGPRYEEELELLVSAGLYNNQSEALRDAIRKLYLGLSRESRMNLALVHYRTHRASITRAAEIAGVDYEDMRDRLIAESILQEGVPESDATPASRVARRKDLSSRMKKA